MSDVKLIKENVDNATKLWLPDKELCAAQDELRRIEEWKRTSGGTKKPSVLGIDSYVYGRQLPDKFYEARTPPPVALDSAENLEWYAEHLKRCIYGYEYQGIRITGDMYWFLNFTPFMIALKDEYGEVTTNFDMHLPYFSYQHDYIFKLIEEAHSLGKGFMMMGGRGYGKTYMVLSILAKQYYLKPNSYGIVSASHSGHSKEAFGKLKDMLLGIDSVHPTLALARLVDTQFSVKSGYEVNIDGVKQEQGPMSRLQQVIYGDNAGVTRGSRPDVQLLEECMAPGTKVLMGNHKYKNIEDVEEGDIVVTGGFRKRAVGRVTHGDAEMFEVTQDIGNSYIVNGAHKLHLSYFNEFGEEVRANIPVNEFIKRDDKSEFYGVRVDKKRTKIKIKSVGPGSYHGFTIIGDLPEDHTFILSDGTITHNCGDWSTGKADLKSCINASRGSWRVGGIFKCRVFLIGTGGSVATDQAKDIFTKPDAYDLLSVDDFTLKAGHKHAVFIPSHYLYGGAGWERTGVNNNEEAKRVLTEERRVKEDDVESHNKFVQEFPFTVEEVFKKSGTNIFHQRNIAKQWSDIQFGADHVVKEEVGFLEWRRSKAGKIIGVEWAKNPNGNIQIIEHPYHGKSKKEIYPDLYVMGVDSIDQGQLDSTTNKQRSSLAALVKKRIVDGEYFQQTSNLYVAKYIGRSLDVRDDYEECLKLTMYYSAKINIEYTKIGIVQYFRERKQWHRFIKRPAIAKNTAGSGELAHIQKLREQTLIGTTVAPNVIDYGDGKIKEYTRDHCHLIFFAELLEQLRDYQREDRTKYDLVIAMALCEIADEDMLGAPARANDADTRGFEEFGYYTDAKGKKKFGVIPKIKRKVEDSFKETTTHGFRWIDMNGLPRFDDKFDVLDVHDIENAEYDV